MIELSEHQQMMAQTVRDFVEREVIPVAAELEHRNEYPHATETAAEVSLEAMRIMGGNGFSKDFPVERYYRDAPLSLLAVAPTNCRV